MGDKTLRDKIAIAAMQAIIAKSPLSEVDEGEIYDTRMVAVGAYEYADVMLAERARSKPKYE